MPQNAFDNSVDSFFEFNLKHLKHVYINTSTRRPDLDFYLKFQGFILVFVYFASLFIYYFICLFIYNAFEFIYFIISVFSNLFYLSIYYL